MIGVAVIAALAAAFFFALAAALQQRAAGTSVHRGLHPALLADLARQPYWLAGIAAGGVGTALQAGALAAGPLAVVQPVGVTTLLFALPVGAALHGRHVARGDLYAAGAVVVGLGALLLTLRTGAGGDVDGARLAGLLAVAGAVLASLVLAASRTGGAGRAVREDARTGDTGTRPGSVARTVLLAASTGVGFGVTAALVQTLLHRVMDEGLSAVFSPLALAAGVFSLSGLLLCQAAYQAGRLPTALATILVVDPLVAVTVGAVALRQPIRAGAPALVIAEVLLVAVGVVVLARRTGAPTSEGPRSGGPPPGGTGRHGTWSDAGRPAVRGRFAGMAAPYDAGVPYDPETGSVAPRTGRKVPYLGSPSSSV